MPRACKVLHIHYLFQSLQPPYMGLELLLFYGGGNWSPESLRILSRVVEAGLEPEQVCSQNYYSILSFIVGVQCILGE